MTELTADLVVRLINMIMGAASGGAFAWLLDNIPGLRDAWNLLTGDYKRVTVAVLSFGIPAIIVALRCVGIGVGVDVQCPADANAVIDVLVIGASALVASQQVHVKINKQQTG